MTTKEYKKVETAFNNLAESILKKIDKGEISETTVGVKISEELKIDPIINKEKKKYNCC